MRTKLSLLLFVPALVGCQTPSSSSPTIVASFYPIYFAAKQIAGDHFQVSNLTPPGSEPHDYELTAKSVAALNDAKLVFVNGLGLEPWTDSLTPALAEKTIILSEGIRTISNLGKVDPHIWLSLSLYEKMAAGIYDRLCQIDAPHFADYTVNFVSFCQKIEVLQEKCQEIAKDFAHPKPVAVSHAAFGYMAADFGFEQIYINGLSPDEEPSPQALGAIIDAIEEHHIDTIFFEELTSDAIAKSIASYTGAKTEVLNPLEGLTQESLDRGEDYFSVYETNMRKIGEAKP